MKPHIVMRDGVWKVYREGKFIESGSTMDIAWGRYFLVTWGRCWDIFKRGA